MGSLRDLLKQHELPNVAIGGDSTSEVSLQTSAMKTFQFNSENISFGTCRGGRLPLRTPAKSLLLIFTPTLTLFASSDPSRLTFPPDSLTSITRLTSLSVMVTPYRPVRRIMMSH